MTAGNTPMNARSNPHNFYARNWGLGRVAMLLKEPNATDGGRIRDNANAPQSFYGLSSGIHAAGYTSLSPLSQGISARKQSEAGSADNPAQQVQWSRYDLAGTTIDLYRGFFKTAIANGKTN